MLVVLLKKSSSMGDKDDMGKDDGNEIVRQVRTKQTNCAGGAHVGGWQFCVVTRAALFRETPTFRGTP